MGRNSFRFISGAKVLEYREMIFHWLIFLGFCWLEVDFYTLLFRVRIIRSSLFLLSLESLMEGSDGYEGFMVSGRRQPSFSEVCLCRIVVWGWSCRLSLGFCLPI